MNNGAHRPLVVITGPTAVGKSELSVKLAEKTGGEIISADSVQVYRNMDIGSAKIRLNEMHDIRHYLINVLDPKENFNVVMFRQMAAEACCHIYDNGHIPVVAGGTGFYIQALLYDVDFTESEEDDSYRDELRKYAEKAGNDSLHEKLREVDPKAAEQIHPNNLKRVIRALEFNKQTGRLISEHNEEQHRNKSPYDFCYFVLTDERETIYRTINERVDKMMEEGLADEVKRLLDSGCTSEMVSMQALGYKQLTAYFMGKCDLDEAVEDIKEETRHFAKRQLTWFRREKNVIWINKNDFAHDDEAILEHMLEQMHTSGII